MDTQVISPTEENLKKLSDAILAGKLVAIPTETVYGLGANAFNVDAVLEVFKAKERPLFDPLICHVSKPAGAMDEKYLEHLDSWGLIEKKLLPASIEKKYLKLMEKFWPGPLTLLFPRGNKISDLVTSGLSTVGVRMPDHGVTQKLLSEAGVPVAAPSANRFGRISPTTASAVSQELSGRIPYILDGGQCGVGLESTVVGFEEDRLVVLRPGGVSMEALSAELGEKVSRGLDVSSSAAGLKSPGMTLSHYAPSKPFHVLGTSLAEAVKLNEVDPLGLLSEKTKPTNVGVLIFSPVHVAVLSHMRGCYPGILFEVISLCHGPLKIEQAARNLFYFMRKFDESNVQIIFAEASPTEEGLGFAISDRLKRAAIKAVTH